jgi:hypothetical protein
MLASMVLHGNVIEMSSVKMLVVFDVSPKAADWPGAAAHDLVPQMRFHGVYSATGDWQPFCVASHALPQMIFLGSSLSFKLLI